MYSLSVSKFPEITNMRGDAFRYPDENGDHYHNYRFFENKTRRKTLRFSVVLIFSTGQLGPVTTPTLKEFVSISCLDIRISWLGNMIVDHTYLEKPWISSIFARVASYLPVPRRRYL
jgi:hypothetical protein